MNIYVYSDESGVLDKVHNDYFVFGGLIVTSKKEKEKLCRRYISVEKMIKRNNEKENSFEVKASNSKVDDKRKLYGILKKTERFCIVVKQKNLNGKGLFENKKTKQRYLDWVYKFAVRKKLEEMISEGKINPNEVENIIFNVDEHTTATDGIYELRESLEVEFKSGMYNFEFMKFHKPLFPNVKSVSLEYCNSEKKTLIRASDIIANYVFNKVRCNGGYIEKEDMLNIVYHP